MVGTFNVNGGGPGEWSLGKVVLFLLDACQAGSYWHVTVLVQPMPEPMPERAKWPDAWSGANRLWLVPGKDIYDVFFKYGDGTPTQSYVGSTYGAPFGIRADDKRVIRIATNDNGYVKLSEVQNGE